MTECKFQGDKLQFNKKLKKIFNNELPHEAMNFFFLCKV